LSFEPDKVAMANPRAFIAFDYDHDEFLRTALVGQSKHPDTDFDIADWSVKEPFAERDWEKKVRTRIRQTDVVIVICGQQTHWATGVATELRIAREEGIPFRQTRVAVTVKRIFCHPRSVCCAIQSGDLRKKGLDFESGQQHSRLPSQWSGTEAQPEPGADACHRRICLPR
jgi:MTH538 TIR-like domain (DUF1863)